MSLSSDSSECQGRLFKHAHLALSHFLFCIKVRFVSLTCMKPIIHLFFGTNWIGAIKLSISEQLLQLNDVDMFYLDRFIKKQQFYKWRLASVNC